jgi:thiamine-phosphate pyrophosphorylase
VSSRSKLPAPILCYVTDRHSLAASSAADTIEAEVTRQLLGVIEATVTAGVNWIQIREKDMSGLECSLLVRHALQSATSSSADSSHPARILVNDRLDVALAERAGGVHLGANSLSVRDANRLREARSKLKPDFLLGVSCHSQAEAASAARDGADYLFFGPIFPTPSKAQHGPPQGPGRLAEVCRSVAIPVIAIGGITLANASLCLVAGAAGIAAIRLFQDAPDLPQLIRALRQLSIPSRPS